MTFGAWVDSCSGFGFDLEVLHVSNPSIQADHPHRQLLGQLLSGVCSLSRCGAACKTCCRVKR